MYSIFAALILSSSPTPPVWAVPVLTNAVSAGSTNLGAVYTNRDVIVQSNYYVGALAGVSYELRTGTGYGVASSDCVGAVADVSRIWYSAPGNVIARATVTNAATAGGATVSLTMTTGGNYSRDDFSNFVTNTVASSAYYWAKARTNGQLNRWAGGVRNTNFWLADAVGLEALPTAARGMLIASNALLSAHHVAPGVGSQFVFFTDQWRTGTVLQVSNVASDVSVSLLSLAGVRPLKLAPTNWTAFAPCASNGVVAFPVFYGRQTTNIHSAIAGYNVFPSALTVFRDTLFFPALTASIVGGDSGSPILCAVGGELFALGTFFTAAGGPFAGSYINEINAAIAAMSATHGLTYSPAESGDWSAYPTP